MAFFRKPYKKKELAPYVENDVPVGVDREWYLALCRTFPRGARWSHNPEKNAWLRKQYEAGLTPKDVRGKLHVYPM